MNSVDEVRTILMEAFQQAHILDFPDMLVDLPNIQQVDIDNQQEAFVKVDFFIPDSYLAALEGSEIPLGLEGKLYITHFAPKNSGMKASAEYADMLNSRLAFHTFSGVTFSKVKITSVNMMMLVDWETVIFTIDYELTANNA